MELAYGTQSTVTPISDIGWFVVTEPSLFYVAECRVHMHGSPTSYRMGGLGQVQCSLLTISISRVRAVRLASPTVVVCNFHIC